MSNNGKALHPEEEVEFTPDLYLDDGKPEDGAPVFRMRPIPGYVMAPLVIFAGRNDADSRQTDISDQIKTALRWSIVGWENVKDVRGKPLEFEGRANGQPTESCLARLNWRDSMLVWEAAMQANMMTVEEVGN